MRESERRPRTRARVVRTVLGGWRLALAIVEVVAIVANFTYVLGFSAFGVSNFFCYFTIMTAIATVPTLVAGGVFALRRPAEPRALAMLRTVVLTHLLLSGLVFGIIVSQASTRDYRIEVPWSDQLLHFLIPVLVLADWLVDRFAGPLAVALPWRTVLWAIPFPTVWLAFTLWRGQAVGWYPYFFLDPAQVSGPWEIAMYCAAVLVIIMSMTGALVWASRARCLRPA
ncbi:hypothetical protein E6C70_09565 [Glaciibacter flavus]|uniref:Pr6Pr family membrane protein n=1 Tax=Orlajensenia flava TaxID=2565934 RepID=A0A4S4FXR5_9MICO|nr:Pr6Pr family membrane protein [Glaciibacter flavus]THG34496.1 hypothetical protein E6C70_09565 [Glaciibacter flavus]